MSIFIRVLDALNRTGASYVVVGGVAGNLLGNVRLTTDLDLVFDLAPRSCLLLIDALTDIGFTPRAPINPKDFAVPEIRKEWIESKGARAISFFHQEHPGFSVDVFTESPVPWELLLKESAIVPLGGISTRRCSIEHLIQMKRAAGRQKDLADLEALEKIRG